VPLVFGLAHPGIDMQAGGEERAVEQAIPGGLGLFQLLLLVHVTIVVAHDDRRIVVIELRRVRLEEVVELVEVEPLLRRLAIAREVW